jgi:hypothetical protein
VVPGSAHKAKLKRSYTSASPLAWRFAPSWIRHELCHDDYLQADRRKEVEDFKRRIEVSLDDGKFINDGGGEFDNLHLRNMNDDLNSGVRCENDETTPNPVYGDMNTDGCRRWHYNINGDGNKEYDGCRGRHNNIRQLTTITKRPPAMAQ